ncbi:unnamed protein product [Owenia fusiformis]|uniref:Uncharacterized protein n=1 Tax=Owenia fusiformis TaxID=6347 RepID=A0A8J1UA94_OWEFU|nr:unnamed protein product [Owenia fusiformis]
MANVDEVSPLLSKQEQSLRKSRSYAGSQGRDGAIRQSVSYSSINTSTDDIEEHDPGTSAMLHRYKYYNKLAPHSESSLVMPDHVVPSLFFLIIPGKDSGKQGSIVTIFSIWNTMMGTSLLSMPWAISQAGFGTGIAIMVVMSGIMLFTAYRVVKSIDGIPRLGEVVEFSDICKYHLGRVGEFSAVFFSLFALLGAMVVYWVLMSNFLYNTVAFIYESVNHQNVSDRVTGNGSQYDVLCPNIPLYLIEDNAKPINNTTSLHTMQQTYSPIKYLRHNVIQQTTSNTTAPSLFDQVWNQTTTVPLFLILVLFPLMNFKSPTFFTKFNSLGTISVLYLLTFTTIKGVRWGFHLDFNPAHVNTYVPEFETTLFTMTGILSLGLFIHNAIISIMRTHSNPKAVGRDLTIAYILVALTYLYIGVFFFATFPLHKYCIEDNFLNNFLKSDTLSVVARVGLFFQMVTVFPLLIYIFRLQFMHSMFGAIYPSIRHVLVLNVVLTIICVLFAIFLPSIGTIIRFSGAFCGLAYAFTLPCLVYILHLKDMGKLTWFISIVTSIIILLGIANFIGQFLVIEK